MAASAVGGEVFQNPVFLFDIKRIACVRLCIANRFLASTNARIFCFAVLFLHIFRTYLVVVML